MLRFFGKPAIDNNEKLRSTILLHCSYETLLNAKTVNSSWRQAIQQMDYRKTIYETMLMQCNFFTNVYFHSFEMTQLSGGLTNCSFKITVSGQALVARIPGKSTSEYIDRNAEYQNANFAYQCNINSKILYYDINNGSQISVFLNHPKPMTKEKIKSHQYFDKVIKALLTVHQSKNPFVNDIDIFSRNADMLKIITENQPSSLFRYASLNQKMLLISEVVTSLDLPKVPCHNDTTPSNFISSDKKMYLIDWEYSGNNYAIWDLVCLAVEADLSQTKVNKMLKIYYGHVTPEISHLFTALQPVYEYWVALWAGTQISKKNYIDDPDNLISMEKIHLEKCKRSTTSSAFKKAIEYLQNSSLEMKPKMNCRL